MLDFKLDEGGALRKSEASIRVRGGPRPFDLEPPFPILLRVRGERLPFFAVWIQNAELPAEA